jgi:hypothetical protein
MSLEALPLNAHLSGYESSIASIHAKSNELFETFSWSISAEPGQNLRQKYGSSEVPSGTAGKTMRFEGGAFSNYLNFLRRLEGLAFDETNAGGRKDTPGNSGAIICRPE